MNFVRDDISPETTDAQTVLAKVLADRHPSLDGRVRIEWEEAGECRAAWALSIRGVAPRPRDSVLVALPGNGAEPVVTGILDRLHPEAEPLCERGPDLRVEEGEALRVEGPDGTPWLEVSRGSDGGGPRLRFLVEPEGLDMPGVLRLAADMIELSARCEIRIEAEGDTLVRGETVQLN